jgi:hypothetical protein
MRRYTVYFIWKLLCVFRVMPSPITSSANNYLQHLVFITPLLLSVAVVEELELVLVWFLFCCQQARHPSCAKLFSYPIIHAKYMLHVRLKCI